MRRAQAKKKCRIHESPNSWNAVFLLFCSRSSCKRLNDSHRDNFPEFKILAHNVINCLAVFWKAFQFTDPLLKLGRLDCLSCLTDTWSNTTQATHCFNAGLISGWTPINMTPRHRLRTSRPRRCKQFNQGMIFLSHIVSLEYRFLSSTMNQKWLKQNDWLSCLTPTWRTIIGLISCSLNPAIERVSVSGQRLSSAKNENQKINRQ